MNTYRTYKITHVDVVAFYVARDARDAALDYAHDFDVDGFEIEIVSRDRVNLYCDDETVVTIQVKE